MLGKSKGKPCIERRRILSETYLGCQENKSLNLNPARFTDMHRSEVPGTQVLRQTRAEVLQGVYRLIVDTNFVMQMGSSRPPGRAHPAQ